MPHVSILNQSFPNGNAYIPFTLAIFKYAADDLFSFAPHHLASRSEFRVRFKPDEPPLVAYGGNPNSGYDIYLSSKDNFSSQHLYQFTHEACHILAQTEVKKERENHPNLWFEECLCEVSSMFGIHRLAAARDKGPCLNLRGEGNRLMWELMREYLEKLLNDPGRQHSGETLKDWYLQNSAFLRNHPTYTVTTPGGLRDRPLNNIVANKLFPLFATDPSRWGALNSLNVKPCQQPKDSFADYLQNWREESEARFHPFVDEIRNLFL